MESRNGRNVWETIEKLAQQIAAADGSSLYDAGREESKAPTRTKVLRSLDQRTHSRKELVERFEAVEEFPTLMIEEVVDDLIRSGLVNGELFASEWVWQCFVGCGKSRMVLSRELREKGIDTSLRADALEQITHNVEEEVARKLAAKRAATIKSVAPDFNSKQKDLRKVVGVLAWCGFPSELSTSIARDQLEERYRELEEDTDQRRCHHTPD